ncbi:MAG: DegV family protein [Lachnospiraceae bacterium]|nr:DegV family protein [Lachnospiraceae bacterium]
MKKVAVMTDSNSGISQEDAAKLGITVIPMPFTIDNVDYYEGVNLTQEEFYKLLDAGGDVLTSQPSPDSIMDAWDNVLKTYDEIVYIPMSSGLSGSCQTAYMLASDYDGKVFVVDNQRISVTQRQSVIDALELAKRGKSGSEIHDILIEDKFSSSIYIMLDTLKYLKKGGRITPAAAALGELLKIKPVLQIQGEKLDAFAKARTLSSGKSIMFNAVRDDANKRFGGLDPNNIMIYVAYTAGTDVEAFEKEVKEEFPEFEITRSEPLSLSISCHIGRGAVGFACIKKLRYDEC